jgi:uncharacterized HAD superfamily protein
MVYGFDIDGVLYPWHVLAYRWYNAAYGTNMTFDYFWKYPDGFVSANEGSRSIEKMVKNPVLYTRKLPHLILNSLQFIADKYASNIYYITSRPEHVRDATRNWLIENHVPYAHNVVFVNGSKRDAVASYGCTYFAEDRPKHLDELEDITNLFIVNTPYNSFKEWQGFRINHIMQIPDIIDGKQE